MNTFRSIFPAGEIQSPRERIDYRSVTGFAGSCFATHIYEKFRYFAFDSWLNPFGIVFHPFAIENAFTRISRRVHYSPDELLERGGIWYSFDHHSGFSALDGEVLLQRINDSIDRAYSGLQRTTHLYISLGTAFVYRHLASGRYVANCHKVPQREFEKELTAPGAIKESLRRTEQAIHRLNPGIQIILTVSPVRHLRDGMTANMRSKAHLITAVHQYTEESGALYFPSYEILMDDLRDYRFYEENLTHPAPAAVDYIFDFLLRSHIDPGAWKTMERVEQIRRDMNHRPVHPDSAAHKRFEAQLQDKIRKFEEETGISIIRDSGNTGD